MVIKVKTESKPEGTARHTPREDVSPAVIKRLPMDSLEDYLAENSISIAVLTMPKEYVKETAERLAALGVKGLWNFASTEIELDDPSVVVQNVHMGDSLMTLCYELTKKEEDSEDMTNE